MNPSPIAKFSVLLTVASFIAVVSLLIRSPQETALAAEDSFSPATHTILKFDVPGAGTGKGQGTVGSAIAADGSITGWYYDSKTVPHAFFRSASGEFTKFDPPGSAGTLPQGLNPKLAIVGYSSDSNGVYHGFVRSSQGTLITLDDPDAGNGSGQGTLAGSINSGGEISGYYLDSNNVYHGFVRAPDGVFTTFDAPGAGTAPFQGTQPTVTDGLTDAGAIAGTYYDSNAISHGFERAPDGTFTTFEVAGAFGTYAAGTNSKGAVAGLYVTSITYGFVRSPTGKINSFVVLSDAPGFSVGTINAMGAITGSYYDTKLVAHGYVRSGAGQITTFDAPGAGTGSNQGTLPFANNTSGEITGVFVDSNGLYHGFLRE
jgi:hypothetical protein